MANDAHIVTVFRTLRIPGTLSVKDRLALVHALEGARVTARVAEPNRYERTYVLAESHADVTSGAIAQTVPTATVYEHAVIALAIEPTPPDALHSLEQALGGPGAPAGVLLCERRGDTLLLEIDPQRTPPQLVLDVADTELRRFANGYRTTELLAPLPLAVLTAIAAQGLQAPEIAPDRVLEALLAHADA